VEANMCRFLLSLVYCRWRSSYQDETIGIPFNRFNPIQVLLL